MPEMTSSSGKTLSRQFTPLGVLLVAVSALTLLFNILGAITASVVGAMMLGTSRRSAASLVFGSLIPPAVVLAWSQFAQEALGSEKRISAAAICFGAYCGTLLFTMVLIRLERDRPTMGEEELEEEEVALAPLARADGAIVPLMRNLGLPELQGRWRCDNKLGNGTTVRREMEITGDHFSLSVSDGAGHSHLLAHGSLRAQEMGAATMLMLYGMGSRQSAA
ncbi:MAG: hypothetical protein ACE5D3_08905 [Candidatus Binatia bacterium]